MQVYPESIARLSPYLVRACVVYPESITSLSPYLWQTLLSSFCQCVVRTHPPAVRFRKKDPQIALAIFAQIRRKSLARPYQFDVRKSPHAACVSRDPRLFPQRDPRKMKEIMKGLPRKMGTNWSLRMPGDLIHGRNQLGPSQVKLGPPCNVRMQNGRCLRVWRVFATAGPVERVQWHWSNYAFE